MTRGLRAALGIALLVAVACTPTYAPPVRIGQHGAPASHTAGEIEVGASVYGIEPPSGGSADLGYSVADTVQLELGADLSPHNAFSTGYAGLRLSPEAVPMFGRARFVFDAEIGGGAGAGGTYCVEREGEDTVCDPDGRDWWERAAGGGYGGFSVGIGFPWVTIFYRGRLQVTRALNVPTTLWQTHLFGLQLDVYRRFKVYGGGGVFSYYNEVESVGGGWWNAGVAVLFGGRERSTADQ